MGELTAAGAATLEPSPWQLVDLWMADLDARPQTKAKYARALRRYVAWLDARGTTVIGATRADVIAYRDHLAETLAASTARAYLAPVRGLYGWLHRQTGRPSVADGVRGPATPRGHSRDALTRTQAQTVMALAEAEAEGRGIAGLRDAALVSLLAVCGLRPVEAVRADVGDLGAMGGRRVLWVQGKGRDEKDDFVVVPDMAAGPLARYLAARGNPGADAPLFRGHGNRSHGRLTVGWVSKLCKAAMRRAGVDSPRLTAHSLRHTAVTAALLGGADLQQTQAMARHSKLETTLVYAHNLDRLAAPAEEAAARYLGGDR